MNAITIGGFGRNDQPQAMSSKEIAELTGKRHDHVLRDIRAYVGAVVQMERGIDVRSLDWGGSEGVQLFGETPIGGVTCQFEVNPQNGQSYPVYYLDKSATLTIVAGYNVLLRKRIIDRWQELEAAAAQPDPLAALNDPVTMRGLLLTYSEKVILLEQANAEMAPKADALDLLSASDGSVTFTQAAKLLGVKQDTMTKWMHSNGWIYRQNGSWVAYSQQIQNGRLEYKEANYTDHKTGMRCTKPYCHLTPKGLAKLAVEFGAGDKKAA